MSVSAHAVVTGASSGIGAAIVERLLTGGWQVTGICRRPPSVTHPAFTHLPLDLDKADAISGAVAHLSPTAFVHAAGFMKVANIGALNFGDGQAMWRLHIEAAQVLANAFATRLPQGGRIVFIGSRTSAGVPGRGQYAATKAALVGMARSWANELASRGITVNVVAPAATETPMLTDPSRTRVVPRLPPIGRYIKVEEVAAAVCFLLFQTLLP
jgi:NAD(P)-dependent dehydrogenase (short-subunit alcohol dehydrogenase family)